MCWCAAESLHTYTSSSKPPSSLYRQESARLWPVAVCERDGESGRILVRAALLGGCIPGGLETPPVERKRTSAQPPALSPGVDFDFLK